MIPQPTSEIGVVHLIRCQNGIEPFTRFLASYRDNTSGVEHDLVLVFKGFTDSQETDAYLRLLKDQPYQSLFVPDQGYDIQPYFAAARQTNYAYYCFLNSFSVILGGNWLEKLYSALIREDAGLVGATGSYESAYSCLLQEAPAAVTTFFKKALHRLRSGVYARSFAPFPNPHLRTNAFLISGDLLRQVRCGKIRSKRDALRFESGRAGLTQQVLGMRRKVFVVGKDGIAYAPACWPLSHTFRLGSQENLIVADNQTRHYQDSDSATRRRLSQNAWGNKADVPQACSQLAGERQA